MGIEFYAVKVEKPQAFYLGKDYYGLSDLFPCVQHTSSLFWKMFIPKLSDLPYLAGSRHIIGPTPFRITDYFRYPEDIVDRIEKIKNTNLDPHHEGMFNRLFDFAQDDLVMLVPDFDELRDEHDRDISCYNFGIPLNHYEIVE